MKPATPRCRAFVQTRSPSTAVSEDELVSTTITSPGWATSRALWTIRLSPGYTLTVHAGPTRRRSGSVMFLISGSIA